MIWKYYQTSQNKVKWVKHLFYNGDQRFSICGVGVQWYDPQEWKSDKEGLAERRECGRCNAIKNRSDSINGTV
jgi:hypothetical protein